MPRRNKAVDDPEDDVVLAPRVTPQQLTELFALGYRGPTPSTMPQAEAILRQWRGSMPPVEDALDAPRRKAP